MVFTFSVVVVRGSERGKVPGPWLRLRRDTGSDGDQESSEGQMSDFTNLETKGKFCYCPLSILCALFNVWRGRQDKDTKNDHPWTELWEPPWYGNQSCTLHINTKKWDDVFVAKIREWLFGLLCFKLSEVIPVYHCSRTLAANLIKSESGCVK